MKRQIDQLLVEVGKLRTTEGVNEFHEVAGQIADVALRSLQGRALRLALEIAAAVADFGTELET